MKRLLLNRSGANESARKGLVEFLIFQTNYANQTQLLLSASHGSCAEVAMNNTLFGDINN
jgi:hypothetical protein